MIKSFEELGEVLGEIENRLSFLENSQHFHEPKGIEITLPEPEWTKRQWDKVQQLQSEVQGWREKHAEALLAIDKLTKQKPKRKSRYS